MAAEQTTVPEGQEQLPEQGWLRKSELRVLSCLFDRSRFWLFLFWFLFILLHHHRSIARPPIWDSAMGLFPAAIYLSEHQFDVTSLLQQGDFWQGGPNVHVLSLLTWVIAVVLSLTGSATATFAIMHLLMFAGMAWAMTVLTRLIESWKFDRWTALFGAMFVLLMPIVLGQVGRIYMELPTLILGVLAVDQWNRGRINRAILIVGVALIFKLTAVAVMLAMLAVLVIHLRPIKRSKLFSIFLLVSVVLIRFFLPRFLMALAEAVTHEPAQWGGNLFAKAHYWLASVPDLDILLKVSLIASLALLFNLFNLGKRVDLFDSEKPGRSSRLVCVLIPWAFALGTLAMIFKGTLMLPRYLIPAVPFSVVTMLILLQSLDMKRRVPILLVIFCLFFAVNRDGRFYRSETQNFSIVERSEAIRAFHDVQIQSIKLLNEKPDEMPAYVTREIDYMISSPLMGYVERKIPNTFPIYADDFSGLELERMPDEFLLVKSNRFQGGNRMKLLVDASSENSNWKVEETRIESEAAGKQVFESIFYQFHRIREQPQD